MQNQNDFSELSVPKERQAHSSFVFFKVIFTSQYTSGYFTTIAAIILFSSVQLIFIGVLGEYIGKIYYEVKNRPHFIVSKSNIKQAEEDKIG